MTAPRPDTCPVCRTSWLADPIPPAIRHHYGGATRFRRTVTVYDLQLDQRIFYACPDCKACFHPITHERLGDIVFVPNKQLEQSE